MMPALISVLGGGALAATAALYRLGNILGGLNQNMKDIERRLMAVEATSTALANGYGPRNRNR
jgi:hypothetical protein